MQLQTGPNCSSFSTVYAAAFLVGKPSELQLVLLASLPHAIVALFLLTLPCLTLESPAAEQIRSDPPELSPIVLSFFYPFSCRCFPIHDCLFKLLLNSSFILIFSVYCNSEFVFLKKMDLALNGKCVFCLGNICCIRICRI